MITQLNKDSLYNTFGVQNFNSLESVMDNMAPSLVEYYLSSLCDISEDIYLNRREIETTLTIGDYSLYIDYNDNTYLEFTVNEETQTETLW
jgi:hypothetical protein